MTATNAQMEEVWCWIHNEQRCVTTKTIALSMGLPRSEAAALLAKLPTYKTGDYSYECTKCCLNQENDNTVIRLCKSIVSGNDMDTDDNNGTVYSLALVDTESVHTAHEKDMAQFRDLLAEEDSPQATATTMALDATLFQHLIHNAEFSSTRVTAHASQEERLSGRVVAVPHAAASNTSSRKMPSSKPRKATTAANFFAAKAPSKSKNTSSKKDSSKPKETAKKPPKKVNDKKKSNKDEAEDMDIDTDANDDTDVQEEKENSCNKKVGNADDFVGDEDEDDDFLEEEEERKRRNAAREKKQRTKKKQVPVQEEEDDDEEPVKVHGAMDAFTQHQEKKPSVTHKNKRRKRLVEKTTMDADGYIHTETQAVWEDVEDDEEEPEPVKTAPIKKAPVKNTKNMKQGSLMGFFKKK